MCEGPQPSAWGPFSNGKNKNNPGGMNEMKQNIKTCWLRLVRQGAIHRARDISILQMRKLWGREVKHFVQSDTDNICQSLHFSLSNLVPESVLLIALYFLAWSSCILKRSFKLQCEKQMRGQLERTWRDQLRSYCSVPREVIVTWYTVRKDAIEVDGLLLYNKSVSWVN